MPNPMPNSMPKRPSCRINSASALDPTLAEVVGVQTTTRNPRFNSFGMDSEWTFRQVRHAVKRA